MENYKPNSNRFKEEQKQKEREKKIVTGKVSTRKKSKASKFVGEFISEDAKNVKSYVFGEVLIPAIKKAVCDIVVDGINMILYGESRGASKRPIADRFSYTNYSRSSTSYRNDRVNIGTGYSYDDIVLTNRGEAEDVLARMNEIMHTYGLVRVADLYDLVGVSCSPTDNSYGWTNITNAEILRVRDGYMIKMPRAIPIE